MIPASHVENREFEANRTNDASEHTADFWHQSRRCGNWSKLTCLKSQMIHSSQILKSRNRAESFGSNYLLKLMGQSLVFRIWGGWQVANSIQEDLDAMQQVTRPIYGRRMIQKSKFGPNITKCVENVTHSFPIMWLAANWDRGGIWQLILMIIANSWILGRGTMFVFILITIADHQLEYLKNNLFIFEFMIIADLG